MGPTLSCIFSILMHASIFTFPVLSFSLSPTFTLSLLSIRKTMHSSLVITSFSLPSILNSQHSVIFFSCYSLFSCLVVYLIILIWFDSQFSLQQHFILFLFFILITVFTSHTTTLFSTPSVLYSHQWTWFSCWCSKFSFFLFFLASAFNFLIFIVLNCFHSQFSGSTFALIE